MITENRKRDLEAQALDRAKKLSEQSLRKEAATALAEKTNADPNSDEWVEFNILDRVYTQEMVRRGLTV